MTAPDRLEQYRCRYAALKPGWEHATARYQRWVAERITPEAHVLDLGCGRGGITERLHGAGRWVGVDPDRASVKEHRVRTLTRAQARSERLPFAEGVFDLVVSSWVLEHLPDPCLTFAEIARILRPGGRFLFLTPNARHPIPRASRWFARMVGAQRQVVSSIYGRAEEDTFPVHYGANTPEQIDRIATQAGLRLVQMELVEDPSYLAWNAPTFGLAVCLEMLLPAMWKVHLIGEYARP
jgi:SAM-dependent methyltransferase